MQNECERLPLWSLRRVEPVESQLRVLVIESAKESGGQVGLQLQLAGIQAMTAYGAKAAIKWGASWRPDLIVMEVGESGLNGFGTAQALRELDECWDIAIVAYSSLSEETVRKAADHQEFDAFCSKTSGVEGLQDVIRKITWGRLPAVAIGQVVN